MAPRPLPEIVQHALELFAPLGSLRTKAMFGGWGFYCDDLFFALVAEDTLYLKADAQSIALFKEASNNLGVRSFVNASKQRQATVAQLMNSACIWVI
jgi:DNA transformation protein